VSFVRKKRDIIKFFLVIGGITYLSMFSSGISAVDVTSGATFLTLPYNARQLSTGSAADVNGIDGMFINPASTTPVSRSNIKYMDGSFSFHRLVESISYINVCFAKPMEKTHGGFGFGLVYLNYGDIPFYDADGVQHGNTSAYDMAILGNYSRMMPYKIQAGINTKFIFQQLHSTSGWNLAFDLGAKRRFIHKGNPIWTSLSINHIGFATSFVQEQGLSEAQTDSNFKSSAESPLGASPLPTSLLLSASYTIKTILPKWVNFSTGPQTEFYFGEVITYGLGGEATFFYWGAEFYLRSRYMAGYDFGSWSIGTGGSYKVRQVRIDISGGFNPFGVLGDKFLISGKVRYYLSGGKKNSDSLDDNAISIKGKEGE